MNIFVIVDGTKREIQLDMEATSTIAEVKAKILELENIPIEEQCLFFNLCFNVCDGTLEMSCINQTPRREILKHSELENDKTLESYGVKKFRSARTFRLVRLTSDEIFVRVVFVGIMDKYILSASDTVAQVKTKIEKRGKFPVDQHSLYFGNSELENDKTLKSYGVKNLSTIYLTSDKIIVFVAIDGTMRKFKLNLNASDTVTQMKAKILDQENISMEEQCLIFNNSELEDDKTLKSYGVKYLSAIDLVLLTSDKIIVFVVIDGTTRKFKLNLHACDFVAQVKAKIREQKYIPRNQQRLYFGDIKLENNKTLESYGIKTLSTLRLVLKIDSKNVKRLKNAANFVGPAAAGAAIGWGVESGFDAVKDKFRKPGAETPCQEDFKPQPNFEHNRNTSKNDSSSLFGDVFDVVVDVTILSLKVAVITVPIALVATVAAPVVLPLVGVTAPVSMPVIGSGCGLVIGSLARLRMPR